MKIFSKKTKKTNSLEEAVKLHKIDQNSNVRQLTNDFRYTHCGHHQAYLNKLKRG